MTDQRGTEYGDGPWSGQRGEPAPGTAPPPVYPDAPAPERYHVPDEVRIGVLIAGIAHIVVGAIGLLTGVVLTLLLIVGCVMLPFAAALLVLGILELNLHGKIARGTLSAGDVERIRVFAIIDCVSILFSNLVSGVCGIIVLSKWSEIRRIG